MSAASVISSLLALGVEVRQAWVKSGKDWETFLNSDAFAAIQDSVQKSVQKLTSGELEKALVAIRAKEEAFLNGRPIAQLGVEELSQFDALSDVEHQLANKLLQSPPDAKKFLTVLVQDVLPALVSVAKVVVPLLI
ncbi:MAG TPA: hypothetical protein VI299_28920 [Polyangiales bacterium]